MSDKLAIVHASAFGGKTHFRPISIQMEIAEELSAFSANINADSSLQDDSEGTVFWKSICLH